ncbi:MAG: hypothetical protein KC777_26150 [Cyanobacteria bacterium HKST-UBA02]|nr:hypothetical protein [Cyanobacteria bacterium HKST-UBA02]
MEFKSDVRRPAHYEEVEMTYSYKRNQRNRARLIDRLIEIEDRITILAGLDLATSRALAEQHCRLNARRASIHIHRWLAEQAYFLHIFERDTKTYPLTEVRLPGLLSLATRAAYHDARLAIRIAPFGSIRQNEQVEYNIFGPEDLPEAIEGLMLIMGARRINPALMPTIEELMMEAASRRLRLSIVLH